MQRLDSAALDALYNCLRLGVPQSEIAARFGVSQPRVSQLKNGKQISNSYKESYLNYKKKTAKLEKSKQAAFSQV